MEFVEKQRASNDGYRRYVLCNKKEIFSCYKVMGWLNHFLTLFFSQLVQFRRGFNAYSRTQKLGPLLTIEFKVTTNPKDSQHEKFWSRPILRLIKKCTVQSGERHTHHFLCFVLSLFVRAK